MSAQATEQSTQAKQATLAAKDESTLRTELRSLHLGGIVRVAGALNGAVPGIGIFQMPSPSAKTEALVHAAESMHTSAAVYRAVFVEHGLPSDFLERLAAASAALKESIDARGLARSRRTEATGSMANDLQLGRRIVAMIDASLAHALKDRPATLAAWRQAKRVTLKGTPVRVESITALEAIGAGSPADTSSTKAA